MPFTSTQLTDLAEGYKAKVEDLSLNGARTEQGAFIEAHVRILEEYYDGLPPGQQNQFFDDNKVKGYQKKETVRIAQAVQLEQRAAQLRAEAQEAADKAAGV